MSENILFPTELIEKLRQAKKVMVLTGAGVSAESGLPTFRDMLTGLWENYDPTELATPQAFSKNPKLVWDWYAWRKERALEVKPNAGHYALAAMEKHIPDFYLFTQNVDGLHQEAGSQKIAELHGNIRKYKCFAENTPVESWESSEETPPRCPRCGSYVRPDIVWFGESLPERVLQAAFDMAQNCEIFFSIGTSGTVQPAAYLATLAEQTRATVVYVNLEVKTGRRGNIYNFNAKSGELLPALVKATWS